jgi:hypothetical protein
MSKNASCSYRRESLNRSFPKRWLGHALRMARRLLRRHIELPILQRLSSASFILLPCTYSAREQSMRCVGQLTNCPRVCPAVHRNIAGTRSLRIARPATRSRSISISIICPPHVRFRSRLPTAHCSTRHVAMPAPGPRRENATPPYSGESWGYSCQKFPITSVA